MDSTHLHLILNHFPIIGTILGTAVMAYGYYTQSLSTQRAALMIWVAMAAIAIPVFLTGEPAEERVENLPGISEAIIEMHEEAAEMAIWVMEALGLLSLAALLLGYKKESTGKTLIGLSFVLSLIAFALMARTGYLGGQIRHTEIRSGAAAEMPVKQGDNQEQEKGDDD